VTLRGVGSQSVTDVSCQRNGLILEDQARYFYRMSLQNKMGTSRNVDNKLQINAALPFQKKDGLSSTKAEACQVALQNLHRLCRLERRV
jgi:hypothetical protein